MSETYVLGDTAGPLIAQVVWSAPGSLHTEEVAHVWATRARLRDLRTVGGPWATVLWDPVKAEHLVVADPLGVIPLYWARTSAGRIAVSAWLAKLVDRTDVDDRLDYEGILLTQAFGVYGEETLERTSFQSVRRVPGGRALRVSQDGSVCIERYWDPRDLAGPDSSLSLADCAELLRDRIDRAVRRLTPASGSVGAHVSGGLDCTSVACRANHVLGEHGQRLVAGYSWAPHEDDVPRVAGDERALLDEIARAEGIPIRRIPDDVSGDWFWSLDPSRYLDCTHSREVCTLAQARSDGVRVLLSGWGGDELASFNGRGVLTSRLLRGHPLDVWRDLGARQGRRLSGPGSTRTRSRAYAAVALTAMPPGVQLAVDRWRFRSEWRHSRLVDRAMDEYSGLPAELRRRDRRAFAASRSHHEKQLHLLESGHIQHRTAAWYQSGRVMGIEYRYPLLDVGVVEAALSLPWWAFRSGGWTRHAFRLAVEPWVPQSVAWNPDKSEPALYQTPRRIPAHPGVERDWHSLGREAERVRRIVDLSWE